MVRTGLQKVFGGPGASKEIEVIITEVAGYLNEARRVRGDEEIYNSNWSSKSRAGEKMAY